MSSRFTRRERNSLRWENELALPVFGGCAPMLRMPSQLCPASPHGPEAVLVITDARSLIPRARITGSPDGALAPSPDPQPTQPPASRAYAACGRVIPAVSKNSRPCRQAR